MASADLYLERIDFQRYLNQADCKDCGYPSCGAFIAAISAGTVKPGDCSFIRGNQAYALEAINDIRKSWPEVPLLMHPRPGFNGVVELNNPDADSLVLVSGNNEYTEQVLMTVLGTTICPFHVLFVDTGGNTVDMAMIYGTLTAERIHREMEEADLNKKVLNPQLIIPGLAAPLKRKIEELTGCRVRVGPVCAAELPLFLSEIWVPPS